MIQYVSKVLNDDRITETIDVLVMVALANHANEDGRCWPSMNTVREYARKSSVRSVQASIKRLEASGLLFIESREQRTNVFTLYPGEGYNQPPRKNCTPAAHCGGLPQPTAGDSRSPLRGLPQPTASEPSIEPSDVPSTEPSETPWPVAKAEKLKSSQWEADEYIELSTLTGWKEAWAGFVGSRLAKDWKSWTKRACQLTLQKLAQRAEDAVEALNECTANGWKGIDYGFAAVDRRRSGSVPRGTNRPADPEIDRELAETVAAIRKTYPKEARNEGPVTSAILDALRQEDPVALLARCETAAAEAAIGDMEARFHPGPVRFFGEVIWKDRKGIVLAFNTDAGFKKRMAEIEKMKGGRL